MYDLAIQKFLKIQSQNPDFVSFAAGLPDTSVLPIDAIRSCKNMLNNLQSEDLQYHNADKVRSTILRIMTSHIIDSAFCNHEVLMTDGAQQGIYLIILYLQYHKKRLLIEQYTYPGLLHVLSLLDIETIIIQDLNDLEHIEYLARYDKFDAIYTIPNGHNPMSYSMSPEIRKELHRLSMRYGFMIIDDDPYGLLGYEKITQLFSTEFCSNNWVYIGSFSKILAPSFRTGWIYAPHEMFEKLKILKDMINLDVSNFNFEIVNNLLLKFSLNHILKKQIKIYSKKVKEMKDLFLSYLPDHILNSPTHGLFFCLFLLKKVDLETVMKVMMRNKVICIPSSYFTKNFDLEVSFLRISFAQANGPDTHLGIKRLQQTIFELYHT